MTSPFTSAFNTLANDQLSKWHLPGASMSLIHGDETWTAAYGYQNLEKKIAADEKTLFFSGSTTKAFLCAAWGIYIHSEENKNRNEGKIAWNTKLRDIVPEDFKVQGGEAITLEDVLSHRSGMPRHELSYGHGEIKSPKAITRNLRNLGAKAVRTELRTQWEYCNTGYVAATHALEVVTGKACTEVLREWIWEPLGMKDTFGGWEEVRGTENEKRMQGSYSWGAMPGEKGWDDAGFKLEPNMELGIVSGAGYIVTTASDYAKWMRCLINSSAPLSPEIIKDLFTPRSIVPPSGLGAAPYDTDVRLYALGWMIDTWKGRKVFHHSGGLVGGGAYVLIIPGEKLGACFLSNGSDSGLRFTPPFYHLLGTALDLPEETLQKNITAIEERIPKFYAGALDREKAFRNIYPDAPFFKPAVTLAIPVAAYAGTYSHPAFGKLKFTLEPPEHVKDVDVQLWWDINDRTWPAVWALRHVNAELWIAEAVKGGFKAMRRVESKVGEDGKVKGFRIAMEEGMQGVEDMFWFPRVES